MTGTLDCVGGLPSRVTIRATEVATPRVQRLLLCAATALLCVAGCATAPVAPKADAPAAVSTTGLRKVPLIVSGQNALLVEVSINKGEPVLMLVDTGAQSTVLDITVARKLGLSIRSRASYSIGVGAGRVEGREAEATTFTLGDVDTQIAPRVQDFTGLTWSGLSRSPRPVVGLLGFDVLRSYGAILDVGRGELWLKPDR